LIANTVTKISNLTGWTNVFGYSYTSTSSTTSYHYAYGIRNGYLYSLQGNTNSRIGLYCSQFINCNFINCEINNGISNYSKIFNSKLNTISENSLIVNCEGDINISTYSTIVNSKSSVLSGEYNVYWNNEGSITPNNNAQSKYDESNLLTLENDNSIARFTSTGYYPAKGVQDFGDCPDPVSDEEGYNNYVNSFGNWKPNSNSFLKNKGIKLYYILTDIEGTERPETPTLGAYEANN
jgi:hypothetical protein